MSEYQLNKLLFMLAGQHKMVDSLSEEDELGSYELSQDEKDALKKGDTIRLYELGANPYLIRRVFRPRFKV
jgi:hypothetical protein